MHKTNNRPKRTHSNEDSKRSPTKRQFRNENEKRRRDLFSQLISNLEDILNIDKSSLQEDQTSKGSLQSNKLDKASILRETAIYLRKHHQELTVETNIHSSNSRTTTDEIADCVDFAWKPPSNILEYEEWIQTTIESMNCFLLITKSDPYNAQIVYASKNISSLLDYSQNELIHHSLFEFISPRNHDQLRDYFLKDHKVLEKCNLFWRRATTNEFEYCTIIGAFRKINKDKEETDDKYLISIVKLNTLDRTIIVDNKCTINQFQTRINLHGRFIHVDSKAREFLGYNSYELIGHTYFDFVHPDDFSTIVRAHQIWKENGNGKSDPYRFLTKGQQWVFLETYSQVQINSWTGKPESYLCTSNPLQNSSDCLHRPISYTITPSQMFTSSIQYPLITSPQNQNSSSESQISSFLSHLGNETYRTNIRRKLNEHQIRKQAEIRVREEEIKVIEDLIKFIDEFESKRSKNLPSKSINPCSSLSQTPNTDSTTFQSNNQENLNRNNQYEYDDNSSLIRSSSINNIIDRSSNQSSPINSSHNSSSENPNVRSLKDEAILDRLTNSLFSPQQDLFNSSLSNPSYLLVSNSLSIPTRPLSTSTIRTTSVESPPQLLSPLNNDRNNLNNSNIISISPISSPLTDPIATPPPAPPPPATTTNPDNSNEKSSRKSSFNRSLPHSLVS